MSHAISLLPKETGNSTIVTQTTQLVWQSLSPETKSKVHPAVLALESALKIEEDKALQKIWPAIAAKMELPEDTVLPGLMEDAAKIRTWMNANSSTLSSITSLNLSSLDLNLLPKEIGSLTALRSLDLSSNQLTALPNAIENLKDLSSLNLRDNKLTALPKAIESLEDLNVVFEY